MDRTIDLGEGGVVSARGSVVDVVVKIGGGLLQHAEDFASTLATISQAAVTRRVLVVPGGGPFADAVRTVDQLIGLSDDDAHWLAVLAMDQYARVVAGRLAGALVVATRSEIAAALDSGRVPVLAPSRWMQEDDPLPHSWDVTSDSIAAWVSGAVDSERLILVKPPGAAGDSLTDAYFQRALPARVTAVIVTADRRDLLQSALEESVSAR